jgi:hypothetical protein
MKNIGTLSNFLEDIKNNGISKQDVKLIEDTVGENFISSIVNIKTLTTERSTLGLDSVYEVVQNYIVDESKETMSTLPTFTNILTKYSRIINFLETFLKYSKEIQQNYNSSVKENLLNKKEYYNFNSLSGKETIVSNIFESTEDCGNIFNNWKLETLNLPEDIITALSTKISYDDMDNKMSMLTLLIYKDNDLFKYFVEEDYQITNVRPTVKELFLSLDGWHMITEGLEAAIVELKKNYNRLSSGCYVINYENPLYDRYDDILANGETSMIIIKTLIEIFKKENV